MDEQGPRSVTSEKKLAILDESMAPARWNLAFKLDEIAKQRVEEAVALKKPRLLKRVVLDLKSAHAAK